MNDEKEIKLVVGSNTKEQKPKSPTFQEQLLTESEFTPEISMRLSPGITKFAATIFDLRRKMAAEVKKPKRDEFFSNDFRKILEDENIQRDPGLARFYRNLYFIEEGQRQIPSQDQLTSEERADFYRNLSLTWLNIGSYIEKYQIPHDSLDRFDIHLLTIGTFNYYCESLYGTNVKENKFNTAEIKSRDAVVAEILKAQKLKYNIENSDLSQESGIMDFGREPDAIDQYQTPEKIKNILTETDNGDILHIAPSVNSPQFNKFALLMKRLGADNVQIHGMVEEIVYIKGERKIRLMSPLFTLLCDLTGRDRSFITENDRTFGANDISIVYRDSADEFISRETKGQLKKGQLVKFNALDPNAVEREVAMQIEGYFCGYAQGKIIDEDQRLNGLRTARPMSHCTPILMQ